MCQIKCQNMYTHTYIYICIYIYIYICQIECPYYRCQSICQIRTLFFETHIFLEFLSYIQQRSSAIFIFSWPHRRCGTSGTSPEALPRRYREGFSADSCDTQPKATVVAKAASHLSPRPLQDLRPWNCLVWRAVPHRLKVHGFSVFFLICRVHCQKISAEPTESWAIWSRHRHGTQSDSLYGNVWRRHRFE